jgi:hypothetical protein
MFVFVVVEKIDCLKRKNAVNKSIYWTMVIYMVGQGTLMKEPGEKKRKRKRKRAEQEVYVSSWDKYIRRAREVVDRGRKESCDEMMNCDCGRGSLAAGLHSEFREKMLPGAIPWIQCLSLHHGHRIPHRDPW